MAAIIATFCYPNDAQILQAGNIQKIKMPVMTGLAFLQHERDWPDSGDRFNGRQNVYDSGAALCVHALPLQQTWYGEGRVTVLLPLIVQALCRPCLESLRCV